MAKTKSPSRFSVLYNASEAFKKQLKQPLVERRLRRKIEAAYDSAEAQKLEQETLANACFEDVEKFDINNFLNIKRAITDLNETQEMINAGYEEMFGEPIPAREQNLAEVPAEEAKV